MQGAGYLAIWSDLAPDDETDWAHWITREHAEERVGANEIHERFHGDRSLQLALSFDYSEFLLTIP